MSSQTTIKSLKAAVGEQLAAQIEEAVPSLKEEGTKVFVPNIFVVIGKDREARRDAALALGNAYMNDIYRSRTVVISDHPEEIPARPPKEDATMEEYTYEPALFSVTPEKTNLPDSGIIDKMIGPQDSTTPLAKALSDFARWDIDMYIVLSPLDMFSWPRLVNMSLVGMMCIAGLAREGDTDIILAKESVDALNYLQVNAPESQVLFIDIDKQKVFRTLEGATIAA